jgi:hypothetical protein
MIACFSGAQDSPCGGYQRLPSAPSASRRRAWDYRIVVEGGSVRSTQMQMWTSACWHAAFAIVLAQRWAGESLESLQRGDAAGAICFGM